MSPASGVLALVLAAGGTAPSRPVKVVCYVETLYGGATPAALDLSVCTHVIDAFLLPEASGELRAANGLPRRDLVQAARRGGSRVLVAVGGATVAGATFSALAKSEEARSRFSEALARFVLDGGYDGVDLDWEFPAQSERGLHLGFVRAVRARLEAAFAARRPGQRPLVFIGVTAGAHLESYDFRGLSSEVDGFVQFGYDFRNPALGPWAHVSKLWPDGATKPIEASVRGTATEIVSRGAPREKLIIGLPFYASDGRPWVEVRERALAAPATMDPLFLESRIDGVWTTGPAALAAKARKVLFGTDIAGGAAAGVALWQLGHQGRYRDLTEALRRAMLPGRDRPDGG